MWKQPYSYKEGIVIVIGLMLTGAMLQLSMGPLNWDLFMWRANIVSLAVFIAALILVFILRRRSYFCRFMTTAKAAVPAIAGAVVMTLIMGLTRQVGEKYVPTDPLGFSKMLESWPFILVYVWMTAILGETVLLQISNLKSQTSNLKSQSSIFSHLGLFIILTCGTLGSADMQRLKMYCEQGKPEWRALDAWNNVHELPLAVELQKFTIDEYPPKLMVIDANGRPLPVGKPEILEIDSTFHSGTILGWNITVERRIDNAMPSNKGYVASGAPGSECALLIKATSQTSNLNPQTSNLNPQTSNHVGWVTCGSYQFKYQGLELGNDQALVMGNREPSRYSSEVSIYTKKGKSMQATVEVNHPVTVDGWKIYQYSYDEQMGKWSRLSVFELVSDPWLPAVYIGILLLAVGALGMFFSNSKSKVRKTSES